MNEDCAFKRGFYAGVPIGLGYIPVSFAYGFLVISGGLPLWSGNLISILNLTSAGQLAGTNLIIQGAGYLEILLTTVVINMRYTLMSLSLSQRIESSTPVWKRMILAFGITDETFVVASMEKRPVKAGYMFGLISFPIIGWDLGTAVGVYVSDLLPAALQSAMVIALYAMFIAIIIPASRDSLKVLMIVVMAAAISCLIYYVPAFSFISSGFRIIICTIIAAAAGAWLFPKEYDDEDETEFG